jgi:hypothetical protein
MTCGQHRKRFIENTPLDARQNEGLARFLGDWRE